MMTGQFFLQFYETGASGPMLPVQEAWGQVDLNPDALQWQVELFGHEQCRLCGFEGFRLWHRDHRGKASPCGGMVHRKMMRGA